MAAGNYGFADRFLHRLALGSRVIAEMSFDIERTSQKPDGDAVQNGKHVFISGLARAGTTVLMRRFHSTGLFGTLTYRDMPFVLVPGVWAKISRRSRRTSVPAERAHGDGLQVDVDSPESLDEVFWRIFCGEDYIHRDALVPHVPDADTLAKFRIFVAAVLQSRDGKPTRYLSKTNNSILRLSALRQTFPDALFLVPFRDPLQHAYSLMRQHKRFVAAQHDNAFVGSYMRWLGHHEFGPDHRPFVFDGKRPKGDPFGLGYWLDLWCATYGALLLQHKSNVTFVSFDRLCTETDKVWAALAERAELPALATAAETLKHVARKVPEAADADLTDKAGALHAELLSQTY